MHASLENVDEIVFTQKTIKKMYQLIDRAVTDPIFQGIVYKIVGAAMPGKWKDYRGELNTVYSWYRKNVD